ncbi:MAG: adenylyltransferase/cytidyltransferase family protein [Candidatus Micrarchaeota archaeon]
MVLVMAFGCFDILHPGHIAYLEEAKKLGGELIVVVARDHTIRKGKNREPVFYEKSRLHLVGSLKLVDKAILGDKLDYFRLIRKLKPDVIALGYDQKPAVQLLQKKLSEFGLKTKVVRIKKSRQRHRFKSSLLIQKLRAQMGE